MQSTPTQRTLITVIVLAAAAVSGSLVFLGIKVGGRADLLDRTVQEAVAAQLKNAQVTDPLVDAAIERYIARQRQSQAAAAGERLKQMRRVSRDRDHIYGNPDASVSLIEYSDFECPYCKRFHPTARQIVAAYGGKVNWVYRHFPLSFHNPGALKEAEASECAAKLGGNAAFWRYADLIYARTKSNGKGFPSDQLVPLAREVGLDEGKFRTCLDGGTMTARVKEDLADGSRIGVDGTPANILLNNKSGEARFRPGARPFEAFRKEIDQMLRGRE